MKKILLALTAILALTVAHGQTNVSGGNVSGTWTLAGSPYLIQGSILIPNDSILTIQPGVTINFQGQYKLLVLGRLLSIGTVTDTIIFTAANTTTGWLGIRFDNTPSTNDTSKIYYCKLEYGKATGSPTNDCGGAFYFKSFSKAKISNSRIINCSANTSGGGIYCSYSNPIIIDNIFSNNTAGLGGGIASDYSSPVITNNNFSFNSAGDGGAISCTESGNAKISKNIMSFNTSSFGGGAIYCYHNNSTISNNSVINNSGGSRAGGIFIANSNNCSILYNLISNNSSNTYGGAIMIDFSTNITLANNVISNNSVNTSGGGIFFGGGSNLLIENNTISNNSANKGGAVYCYSSSNPTFHNSILWGNTATAGNQVDLEDEASDPKFSFCNVQGGSAAFELNGNLYTGIYQNNINSNPSFVSASGGSGTAFNGVTANWSLQTSSPSIDIGDPLGFYPSTDLAGNPRLENVTNCVIDMGAYEYQSILCPNNGITDIGNNKISIQIFPNPFSIQTTLQTDYFFHDATLTVDNCFGQTVAQIKNISGQTVVFSRDNLASGLYFVRLTEENKTIGVDKLVIADR